MRAVLLADAEEIGLMRTLLGRFATEIKLDLYSDEPPISADGRKMKNLYHRLLGAEERLNDNYPATTTTRSTP